MVLSGEGQDKPQTGGIAEYTGVGLYHRVSVLTPELVAESVDKILGHATYRDKAKRMAEIYKKYDPHARLDEMVRELMKSPSVEL
jgi:UDP:flavonoid glycosyltransferase YjiC (YdhE family)